MAYDKEVINYLKKLGYPLLFILKEQSDSLCLEAVNQKHYTNYSMGKIIKQNNEICLAAVNSDGMALQFVKIQTEPICLAAVKQNGLALQFVKKQNFQICLTAVKQNGMALQFVNEEYPDLYLEKYKSITIKNGYNSECLICLSKDKNTWCEIKSCNHFFHIKCLMNWIKINSSCPQCRTKISNSE